MSKPRFQQRHIDSIARLNLKKLALIAFDNNPLEIERLEYFAPEQTHVNRMHAIKRANILLSQAQREWSVFVYAYFDTQNRADYKYDFMQLTDTSYDALPDMVHTIATAMSARDNHRTIERLGYVVYPGLHNKDKIHVDACRLLLKYKFLPGV